MSKIIKVDLGEFNAYTLGNMLDDLLYYPDDKKTKRQKFMTRYISDHIVMTYCYTSLGNSYALSIPDFLRAKWSKAVINYIAKIIHSSNWRQFD